ncbi:hypothetical protein B0H15DRAFT_440843 [Mycena belliarum]|uniref:Uncharacterized protein n=1 Tax=Mycena belliarum TaxID=1033014 RepID=A0AAD6U120_9AGAR|nr:hypothetical protein B0H15DRAFT_440843 [Mycena belliae]
MASTTAGRTDGTSKTRRARTGFTQSEDEQLADFLAQRPPHTRTSISTYRETAAEPWGSKHTEHSWLQRYIRRKAHYESLIDALAHKEASSATQRTSEREQNDDAAREPPVKKQRLTSPLINPSDFTLPIPYERFLRRSKPLSDADQHISLNLAINVLSARHGLDPEIVYNTWERLGDLRLTEDHIRLKVDALELRRQEESGVDSELAQLLVVDTQRASASTTAGPSADESGSSLRSAPKRKRSKSPHPPVHTLRRPLSTLSPTRPQRVHGREMIARSSVPDEVGFAAAQPCRAIPQASPKAKREGTVVPETPQSSYRSGAERTHISPSRSDDGMEEEDELSAARSSPQPQRKLSTPNPDPESKADVGGGFRF